MKLTVVVDDQPLTLELEQAGTDWMASGRRASVLNVEPGIYSVLLGDRSYEARIEKVGAQWAVTIGRERYLADVIDPRARRSRHRAEAGAGRQEIASPMPGKVVRVLVREGATVEAGEGIAVVEAMKMQNELKAAQAGRVIRLMTKEGETVTAGEVLAVLE